MALNTAVPTTRLEFSGGFRYYGDQTQITVTAAVDLSVPHATHRATGETLADGELIPTQPADDFHVPSATRVGWAAPNGSTLSGWIYELSLTITATGKPTLLWNARVDARDATKIVNPDHGTLTVTPGGTTTPTVDNGETLVQKLDQGAEDATVTFLGDSTGYDDVGFVRRWAESLSTRYPRLKVQYTRFDQNLQGYQPTFTTIYDPATDAVGAGPTDTFFDTFTRTGSIVGSAPDVGAPWQGLGDTAAAGYSADGTKLVYSAAGAGFVMAPSPASDVRTVSSTVTLNYGGGGYMRVLLKFTDINNYLGLTFPADNKPFLRKVANGALVGIGTLDSFVIPTGPTTMAVTVAQDGANVSATIDGVQLTGSALTASDVEHFRDMPASLQLAQDGASVDDFRVTQEVSVTESNTLTVYNGHVGGAKLDYQLARLDVMAKPADLTVISSSHNYLDSVTPEQYIAEVEGLVQAIRAAPDRAGTGIVVSSQNPRFAHAGAIVEHRDRMVALRTAARDNGWGYVPAWEAFVALPDGGVSYVKGDGVHPKGVDIDPNKAGYDLWRDALIGQLGKHSRRPAA